MAKVKNPQGTVVDQAPVINNNLPTPGTKKSTYCMLCRLCLFKDNEQAHIHSMLHHRELDSVLGTRSFHNCQACMVSSMGLQEFAQHISTAEHKYKLEKLICKKQKPIPLEDHLSQEDLDKVRRRNKRLKKMRTKKNQREKKAKQMKKEMAMKACAKIAQGVPQQNKVASSVLKQNKTKQKNTTKIKHETHLKGSSSVVVQNKENKASTLQKPPHQRETARLPDVPAEPPRHQTSVRDQFTPPIPQMRSGASFSVNSVKVDQFHTERPQQSPHNTEEGPRLHKIMLPAIIEYDIHERQCDNSVNFTSDNIAGCRGLIFDDMQNESPRSTELEQEGSHRSAAPAPANTSISAAPIRVVDVSSMLRQIRRELGVREPCRADREAKKQKSEVRARPAGHSSSQKAGREKRQLSGAASTSVRAPLVNNSCAPAAHPKGHSSSVAKTKQATLKTSQEATRRLSAASAPSNRSALSGKPTFTKPSLNFDHRVQSAHEPSKSHETRLKPTLTNLLTLSGAKRRLSVRDMYNEMQKRKQDNAKGMPRFGITFSKPPTDQEASTQPQDDNSQLSEGFHWESIPDSPSLSDSTSPVPLEELIFTAAPAAPAPAPAPAPTQTHVPAHAAPTPAPAPARAPASAPTPACAHVPAHAPAPTSAPAPPAPPAPPASPASAATTTTAAATPTQQCGTNLAAPTVVVKTEPNQEEEKEGLRDSNSLNKRKHSMDDDSFDKEAGGKKKKAEGKTSNKDQTQLDQLLAVSLRENELSHSLQDLDKSLVQARNALQAAYTEVQRLLLLKQQFSTEVDGLRAQRIEILQGMQEVYSGSSDVAATTTISTSSSSSSTGHSHLPSSHACTPTSSQQTPASTTASSITQPLQTPLLLPATSIKQETCHPPTAGQASQFSSSKTDAPCVATNQPIPMFPHLLVKQCPSAVPASAAAAAATATVATSTRSPPFVHKTKQELKDSIKTEEKVQLVEGDSKEEFRGNLKEEGKGGESAAEKRVSERDHKDVALDDGNVSDGSVEIVESNPVVINIDESDSEHSPETVSNAPVPPEPPQRPVSTEPSSASKPTFQQNDTDRKVQPVKGTSDAVECVEDEEPFLGAFLNHNGPIYSLQVHEGLLYTCSGDNTARAYSLTSGECQAVFVGHTDKVNCLLVSTPPNMPARLYTGSNDETIRCHSLKSKKCLELISLPDRVFCLHIAWNILYVGLANGSVASYDLKTLKQLDVFDCHGPRAVSCLGSSQEGARRVLLIGSYDSTISIRDAKSGLLLRSLQGHSKTVLCIKVVNDLVFSSSSDTGVHAHNIHTGELIRIYKGHSQAVTSIFILGQVMLTACMDQMIRVYDLQSHDRLQVYGGHSDMVMCMAVHKSVIYSGCYDGSIRAVKLNLTKNHHCWWQNCSLIFGIAEHLVQHLLGHHTHPNLESVRCRWRGCDAFFATQQAVQQDFPEHMQNHVQNDSKVEP